jgi:hypothetical protein
VAYATIQGSSLDTVLRISVPFPNVERHKLFHEDHSEMDGFSIGNLPLMHQDGTVPQDLITCSSACRG